MDLFRAMGISTSGLNAQRSVMNVVSLNLANAQTTRTPEGGPYRRKRAMLSLAPGGQPFSGVLSGRIGMVGPLGRTHVNHFPKSEPWDNAQEVSQGGVWADTLEDSSGFQSVHDPTHPDADEMGNVLYPNVNAVEEMMTLLAAVRNFEANVTAFNAAKGMALKSLEIGK
jgi:flagellar basal-body rod protein FlgC